MKKILLGIIWVSLLVGCQKEPINGSFNGLSDGDASTTPYGRYSETVEYTLANLTSSNNSNMPSGDTYENNAYTRYLLEKLNVQNIDILQQEETQYSNSIKMIISKGNLPDVMIVNSYEDLEYLVEQDLIADLTSAYEQCASDKIKDIYNSYGPSIIDNVTFDGKIYALPETNISDGPNMFWVRQDWLDALGIDEPKTLDDVENIVQAFITKDPGGNGEGETLGLMVDPAITGESGYSSEYLLDLVFACYDAYPKQWIEKDGNIIYGSVDSNVKAALSRIQSMYKNKTIDPDFLIRSTKNIVSTIIEGKCGSFFGPWWAPNNPLVDAIKTDPNAVWKPYMIETSGDGTTSYHSQNPSSKFVVVRKGFEHPEIVFKIISVIFDYLRFENTTVEEINEYFRLNVDPTARPISINVDYNQALLISYESISDILTGNKALEEGMALDQSYALACMDYLANPTTASVEDWAAYSSRVEALSKQSQSKLDKVESLFFGVTTTMKTEWWRLESLESETFLKIISLEESINHFDDFVKNWYDEGGEKITKEVTEIVNKKRE